MPSLLSPELVLNDLSFDPPSGTAIEAKRRMKLLVDTLAEAIGKGTARYLLAPPQGVDGLPLAPNYTWADCQREWAQDRADRIARQYLLDLLTAAPDASETSAEDQQALACEFQGKQAQMLGVAALRDGLAVSLAPGDPIWGQPLLQVGWQGSGQAGTVRQVALPQDPSFHDLWIRQRLREVVRTGKQIWEHRARLFSSLELSEDSKKPLRRLGGGDMVNQLLRRLLDLDKCARRWKLTGLVDWDEISDKWSDESESTLKDRKCMAARTWSCDGNREEFRYHLKPDQWRIYFRWEPETRRLFVVTWDEHLPTKNY